MSGGSPWRVGWARSTLASTLLVVLVLMLAPRCSRPAPAGLRITRAAMSEGTDAASIYLVLDNPGGEDRLVSASTDVADAVIPHGTTTGGAMADLDGLTVPAETTMPLEPGGVHLMATPLRRPIRPGERIPVTVAFEGNGTRTLTVPVLAYGDLLGELPEVAP